MQRKKLLILSFFLATLHLAAFAQQPKLRVEPAFWWAGMKDPSLQLMLHGDNIGNLKPVLSQTGAEVKDVIKVKNPNYLFINLNLSNAKPGKFTLQLKNGNKTVHRYTYELKQREAGAANREGFNSTDVIYLITPDRFANGDPKNDTVKGMADKLNRSDKTGRHGGDIAGIIQHLDYIEDMGFTALWVNPVLENAQARTSYHGYSTTDYYKVDPRFGSNEQYVALSAQAKQRGIKLVMDMIMNHIGSEHWWMDDLPTEDWLNFQGDFKTTNHRREALQDPYASAYDRRLHTDGWFVESMPDLNQNNKLLATYLIQNTLWWIEYADLGGIRMDTYSYPDPAFMSEWTRRVMEEYPNFNIVGEEWSLNPAIVAYWQRGKKNPNGYTSYLPSMMDFPIQGALTTALRDDESGWDTGWLHLYNVLATDFLYADPQNLVVFPDNHDMDRIYTQLNQDAALTKLALAYILTTRGIPQIYYGTEILMHNEEKDDHGIIRTDFPGGWAGDKTNAFTGKGLTKEQLEMQQFTKKLLNWRKNAKAVQEGELTHYAPYKGVYVYFRQKDNEKVMVILNKNEKPYELELGKFAPELNGVKQGTDVITGRTYDLGQGKITLPNKAPLVLELK
ncbi:glycoside hydrolase family 13 protein [Pontibacter anaerobius]|uniref:Glycoside hydrolase family 13 protein n=1 Tax=Pontibacter anaerobius TaxID=2993940 RepID=A0ABT3RIW6_9BACT|nr:glycoside hydrolase family 13 protein [Pontibacter anaerobius]MCX2741803.1 glycoside hydrolase family 13 protein [Pontibacter anaerobius]